MSVNIDDDVVDVISYVALFYEKEKSGNSFLRKEKFRAQLTRKEKTSWFLVDPTQIILPMNMVGNSVPGKLRMRKQNTKTTVPLDVVPERRTKRCSPRFRPGGRFCELRFRYQSSPTGIEGEISRPLDHM